LSSGQLTKLREGGHVSLGDDLFPLKELNDLGNI
jgi:hypothetical protein